MVKASAVAVIPCIDLDESQSFYEKLGFAATAVYEAQGYRILQDGHGASLHLARAVPHWLEPERNPFGIYVYSPDLEAIADRLGCEIENKPYGLRELAVSDPNGALVRIGWP